MTPKYRDEVNKLLAGLDDENNQKREQESTIPPNPEPIREIHYIFVREEEDEDTQHIVDSVVSDLDTAPLTTKPAPQPVSNVTIGVWLFGLLVPLFCIAVQLYFMVNPYAVTVTLLAKSHQVSLNGTLQQGRVISPLALSQSQTVPTTGKGHQDAKQATGFITFYNGQPAQQFVPVGALLTSASGIQIVTTQDATIPAADLTANPPVFGQTTISAQAVSKGSKGNIPAYDINEACCATSVVAKNLNSFSGGQDERNFQTVAKSDIDNTAAPLKATLDQSMQNTLTGQLKSGEALTSQHCTPTITADHQAGQEATQVKVTVSETCSGIAYNTQELTSKVTQLLTSQAIKQLGSGYSILENPQITITSATTAKPVTLSFSSVSTWIYALSSADQQHIKKIIAGKNTDKALQLLTRLPGIERVSLQSSGCGDGSRIPKDISYIHMLVIYAAA